MSTTGRTKKLTVAGRQSATYCGIHISGLDTFSVGKSVHQALGANQYKFYNDEEPESV
jgi:hypothetical protein